MPCWKNSLKLFNNDKKYCVYILADDGWVQMRLHSIWSDEDEFFVDIDTCTQMLAYKIL